MSAAEPFPMDAARAGDTARLNHWRARTRQVVGEDNPVDAKFRFEEWRPLQLAAAEGDVRAVETLLGVGADPRCCCSLAARASRLPQSGGALHVAARYGHAAVALLLVEAGCDLLDAPDSFGFTPLHYAAANGHLRTIEALVSRDANVLARSTGGATPADLAKLAGRTKCVEALVAEEHATKAAGDLLEGSRRLGDWLTSINCEKYLPKILAAGYDFEYIRQHGLKEEDVAALGIPSNKIGHAKKLLAKHNFPDDQTNTAKNDDDDDDDDKNEEGSEVEEEEGSEEEEDSEDGSEDDDDDGEDDDSSEG